MTNLQCLPCKGADRTGYILPSIYVCCYKSFFFLLAVSKHNHLLTCLIYKYYKNIQGKYVPPVSTIHQLICGE